MTTAKKAITISAFLAASALALAGNVNLARASAGSPQTCTVGSECGIGEFLYDDEYTPITTPDICSITSRYPDGTSYLDNQNMPPAAESDGWYSYEFTAPATTGYYRTQVCCTVSSELLCVDKDFEVTDAATSSDPDAIASAVWGYSSRTLSSFGSLAGDIWSYSTRSLSTFGTLISNMWSNSSRTLTDPSLTSGSIATKTDLTNATGSGITSLTTEINNVKDTADDTRLLLEKLVNKPIIEYSLEDDVPDLNSKITETKAVANQLYVNNQYIVSKIGTLIKNYEKTAESQVLDQVIELNELAGEESDVENTNTLYGSINWINDSWNWDEGEKINAETSNLKEGLVSIQTSLGSGKGDKSAKKDLQNLFTNSVSLEKLIGTATDIQSDGTLYGKIKKTESIALALDGRQSEVEKLLTNWDSVRGDKDLMTKISDLKRKVLAVNQVPKGSVVLDSKTADANSPEKSQKNSLLSMRGLLVANKLLLAKGASSYIASSWLEEGSVIIKSLVINPSKLISQEAILKYYLPPEIREEDVLSHDDLLSVKYDVEKNQYYVDGKIPLRVNETRVLAIRLEDIFVIGKDEVDSFRSQAIDLSRPLEKTSYFAQGVTLKSDIDASLDKILSLQKKAITPEQRIRAYREALIEKNAVETKLAKLQDLVTLAASTGTLFGFIGSVNALTVWGLIIIMITGFVLMVVFMKKASSGKSKSRKGKGEKQGPTGISTSERSVNVGRWIKFGISFGVFGIVVALASGFIVAGVVSNSVRREMETSQNKDNVEEKKQGDAITPAPVAEDKTKTNAVGGQEIVRINVPLGSKLNLREGPSKEDKILAKLIDSLDAVKISEDGDWVNVAIAAHLLPASGKTSGDAGLVGEGTVAGWVSGDYVEEAVTSPNAAEDDVKEEPTVSVVLILNTSTGWLRVREKPSGGEITKVLPGEKYRLLGEDNGWYEIELQDGTSGWVSSEYTSIVSE
ncbi:hypothetical protein A3A76_00215 [Candidatus Woesebacteria bacterium RIFCSPLOWO2_01_FULL_39_23]|uniref:SH3b domain-containing protein n=1 Tax=Candidatus Woesebacteria bacterium RIFCSPHIGHO2_01_FULL_40_22 TaxID=1802499 RepID=A0A1F7YG37_9BACT|nr:MAG: hypothetical protein A2141_02925 [Candidatus Woesebacteria bacterium RBG_16_40_11]OGM26306.1 MAG: hypothetical protein A2628_03835 [Candidatus Woesebacteria bacterium RIFCSPHIGHO2_01_FULL_40_22]OGM62861.1 MAG: hypothetical protein A3A76_00215 [Candidatus Woesebacteria bacterium RIFCSPLOWO2_01_FULL_39_23]